MPRYLDVRVWGAGVLAGFVLTWLGRPARSTWQVAVLALGVAMFWLTMAGLIATAGTTRWETGERASRFGRIYLTMVVVLGVGGALAVWLARRA